MAVSDYRLREGIWSFLWKFKHMTQNTSSTVDINNISKFQHYFYPLGKGE